MSSPSVTALRKTWSGSTDPASRAPRVAHGGLLGSSGPCPNNAYRYRTTRGWGALSPVKFGTVAASLDDILKSQALANSGMKIVRARASSSPRHRKAATS